MIPTIDPRDAQRAVTDAIAYHAPNLHVSPGINAIALLRALAAQETSDPTRWAASKHERSYCHGGIYHGEDMRPYEWRYGCAVHCSWGPWQIMFPTAAMRGYDGDPVGLRDPMISGDFVVRQLNARLFDHNADAVLEQVWRTWNGGNPKAEPIPGYIFAATNLYNHFFANPGGLRA